MKLQYLGDSRDSFKWDLLYQLVADCDFERLYFVPFLTPDDREPTDGRTIHSLLTAIQRHSTTYSCQRFLLFQ